MRLKYKKTVLTSSLAALALSTPYLLSTRAGNAFTSQLISDITSTQISVDARFSWLKKIEVSSCTISTSKAIIELQDLKIESLLSAWILGKTAKCDISSFTLTWKQVLVPQSAKAGVNITLPSLKLPFNIDIDFTSGALVQNGQLAVDNIDGFLFYRKKAPSEFKAQAKAGVSGLLSLEGRVDLASMNADCMIDIQKCPQNALPEFFLKPFIMSDFDLALNFQGSIQKGKAQYSFRSLGLQLNGEFTTLDSKIRFENLNQLIVNLSKPYVYKHLAVEGLKGSFIIKEALLDFNNPHIFEDLNLTFQGSCDKISYLDKSKTGFTISGSIDQNQNLIELNLDLYEQKRPTLSILSKFNTSLNEPGTLSVNADKFPWIFPSQALELNFGNWISCQGQFNFTPTLFQGTLSGFTDTVKSFSSNLELKQKQLEIERFELVYNDQFTQSNLKAHTVRVPFEDLSKISFEADIDVNQSVQLPTLILPLKIYTKADGLDQIFADLSSPLGQIKGLASYQLTQEQLVLKNSWQGKLTLPSSFHSISYSQSPVSGKLVLEQGSTIDKVKLQAQLDPFLLAGSPNIGVRDVLFKLDINPKTFDLEADLKGSIGQNGHFAAQATLQEGDLKNGLLTLKNPPLDPLGSIHPELKKAAEFFGKNLNLSIKAVTKDNQIVYDTLISSENINLKTAFSLGDAIYLKTPLEAKIKLTSLNLPFYKTTLPFDLKKPSEIELNLKTLNLPPKSAPFKDLSFEGDIKISNLTLAQDQKQVQLDGFFAQLQKPAGSSSLNFKSQGELYSGYGKQVTTGSLETSIVLSGATGLAYGPDLSLANLAISLKGTSFPTLLLDMLQTKAQLPFSSTFGPTLEAKVDFSQSQQAGSLKANIFGQDSVIKLSAIKKDNLYQLSEDAIFQTRISKSLSELIFHSKPLGIQRFNSSYPIVARIQASGCFFSLFPFELNNLAIQESTIDLGRVTVDADNILPQALSLLKTTQNSKNLSVWFQPIHASLSQNILHFNRFDFLVQDAFQLALWGDIDLQKEQVGMILGLTASCLQKAFGITELPASYVLQVPISGPLDNVKIDSKKAAGKIAKIIALQQGGNLLEQFGGKGGGIAGGFLKELSKIPDGDKKAPPPQTPFPWDKQVSKTSHQKEPKKTIRSSDSPVKQIMKMFF